MNFISDLFHEFVSNIFYWVGLIIVVVAGIFVYNYINTHNASDETEYSYEVTADEILEEYKDNNIQAELRYEGNIVKISGTIDSITGSGELVEIVLTDSLLGYRVTLHFTDTKEIELIASLNEGDSIVVVGEVYSYVDGIVTNNLIIKKCNYLE